MIGEIVRLMRPQQWYKNSLVLLALVFSGNLLQPVIALHSLLAAFVFCMLSSATYIINDYADRHFDRLHPEKKHRPLAAGTVHPLIAISLASFFLGLGLGLATILPLEFVYAALGYFSLSQLYTAWFKHEPFLDIITIATNFVIRAIAGALAIKVMVSPWLITGVFFLALFLLLGKRKGELMLLDKDATRIRVTLGVYTSELTNTLSTLATTGLVISYILYTFFGNHSHLYVTIPIALYTIFRYESYITSGHVISRNPEKIFTDVRMVTSMLLWAIITFGLLYVV